MPDADNRDLRDALIRDHMEAENRLDFDSGTILRRPGLIGY